MDMSLAYINQIFFWKMKQYSVNTIYSESRSEINLIFVNR